MGSIECDPEDLTCAMCRDVYCSPRFLIGCYHTFCHKCIDNHAHAVGSQTFCCPICRLETTLPAGGATKLQVNFYLKEEVLTSARRLQNKNCCIHPDHVIDRVCLMCQTAACKQCTNSHTGKGHKLHMLSYGEEFMEAQIQSLEDRLAFKIRELSNLQAKTKALSRQLRHQRDLLHARVDQQYKTNNRELWKTCTKASSKLSGEITYLQKELKKSKNVYHLSREFGQDPASVNVVDVAKQVDLRLDEDFDPCFISTTPVGHPGLVCTLQNDVDMSLSRFLGQPIEHAAPEEETAPPPSSTEVIQIHVQIARPKELREILSIAPSDDGSQAVLCFRGNPPNLFSSAATVQAKDGAVLRVDHDIILGKGVGLYDHYRNQSYPVIAKISKSGVCQISKMEPRVCLFRDQFGFLRLHHLNLSQGAQSVSKTILVNEPVADSLLMHLKDLVDPLSLDVSSDGQYYAIIDKGKDLVEMTSQPPASKKRKLAGSMDESDLGIIKQEPISQPHLGAEVKLFRQGERKPVDVYRPAKPSFLPSDVCFCRWKKRQLLIADWQNDEIHVVHVGKKGFCFRRLLAERHGELVKPSALNTDPTRGVWIGCSNGSLLHIKV